jgi:hypothetical protein
MNEARDGSRVRARKTFSRVGAAALSILTTAMILVVAAPAANARVPQATPCAGAAQAPQFVVNGAPVSTGYGYVNVPLPTFPARYAWRSSCTPNEKQFISVRYRAFTWTGASWVLNQSNSATFKYEVSTNSPGAWLREWTPNISAGSVSVDVTISWSSPTYPNLGSVYWDYNIVDDYRCGIQQCWIYPNGVVGAFVYFK